MRLLVKRGVIHVHGEGSDAVVEAFEVFPRGYAVLFSYSL
jgi:hypothetical protein